MSGWAPAWGNMSRQQALLTQAVVCARTGRRRGLVAQELELLHGYSAARTALLLQEAAPGDAADRNLVEPRRASAVTSALPVTVAALVLQGLETDAAMTLVPRQSVDGNTKFMDACDSWDASVPCGNIAFQLCPYLLDRNERGLSSHKILGPDWADMHACQAARLASGVQQKADGFAASQQRLLPYGLPPETAEALSSPLETPVPLADDLD